MHVEGDATIDAVTWSRSPRAGRRVMHVTLETDDGERLRMSIVHPDDLADLGEAAVAQTQRLLDELRASTRRGRVYVVGEHCIGGPRRILFFRPHRFAKPTGRVRRTLLRTPDLLVRLANAIDALADPSPSRKERRA